MLCYQYTRNASDIIHDTFDWLRINRRALMVIMLPLAILSLGAAFCVSLNTEDLEVNQSESILMALFYNLKPYALYYGDQKISAFAVYVLLTCVATALTVPLLRRYFYYRLSLQRTTMATVTRGIARDWRIVLITTAVMGVMCAGMLMVNILIMLVALWLFVSMLPCVIMSQPMSVVTTRLWTMAKNLFMAALFFCIIQALPSFCITVVLFALYFLSVIMPGFLSEEDFLMQVLDMLMTVLMCLSYCLAVITLLVNLVILHGSLYYNPRLASQ